jgi:hypothetical protein
MLVNPAVTGVHEQQATTNAERRSQTRMERLKILRRMEEDAAGPPPFRVTLARARAKWPEWEAWQNDRRARGRLAALEKFDPIVADLLVDIHLPQLPPPTEVVAHALDLPRVPRRPHPGGRRTENQRGGQHPPCRTGHPTLLAPQTRASTTATHPHPPTGSRRRRRDHHDTRQHEATGQTPTPQPGTDQPIAAHTPPRRTSTKPQHNNMINLGYVALHYGQRGALAGDKGSQGDLDRSYGPRCRMCYKLLKRKHRADPATTLRRGSAARRHSGRR